MSLINGESDKKIILYEKLEQLGPILSLVGFIAGVVYFSLLPHQILIHGTYMSENALLPGLVSSDIFSTDSLYNYYDFLKNNYESNGGKTYNSDLIREIFVNQLKLESYTQSFNLTYPFSSSNQNDELTKSGKNVYAFGRAQRADGTESIVVSAPLFLSVKRNKQIPNLFGVAQLFILADLAKNRPYWAKDLIFVVTDMGHIGMQAWINSYFETDSDYIKSENLNTRGGSIQAALNLEFKDINVNKLEMKLEGANGKLPNLDLFNTIIKICKSIQFECSLETEKSENNDFSYYHNKPPVQHVNGIINMVNMMFKQSLGVPNSLNGYFLNHRIEALTITGTKTGSDKNSKRSNLKQNVLKVARIVESTLRSVNNLLERFHQSFFFYLLPSSHYYVSIGMYMPAFGLLMLPVLIKVLTLWFSIFLKKDLNNQNQDKESSLVILTLLKSIVNRYSVSALFGLILYFGTPYFITIGQKFNLSAKDSLVNCYITVIINILLAPLFFKKKLINDEKLMDIAEKLSKLFVLIALTIFVGTISLLNFSLSFFIVIFYAPISMLAIQKIQNKLLRFLRFIIMALSCPLTYFSILYLINLHLFENVNITQNAFINSQLFDYITQKFYDFVLLSKISGIWTYDMVNLFLIPIWSTLWFTAFD